MNEYESADVLASLEQIASSRDNDRLFSMLPYKSLVFLRVKDQFGMYAMIAANEDRNVKCVFETKRMKVK